MTNHPYFRTVFLLSTVLLGLTLLVPPAAAQTQTIAYQGYLTNTDGDAAQGSGAVVFRLYDEASGGTALWEETQQDVVFTDGLFTVRLGAVESLEAVSFDQPLWLGVAIAGSAELAPRVALEAVPFALSVRGLRVVPASRPGGYAPSVIGGDACNVVAPGVVGATISGGGFDSGSCIAPNTVEADYGVIGGGYANRTTASNATVGGGTSNQASGSNATVGGGGNNTASGPGATVGGGTGNEASGVRATVGGGLSNDATEQHATIGGGFENEAGGTAATIGGGEDNTASGSRATVGGGLKNTASGFSATVGGGSGNEATERNGTIGGGLKNTASGFSATVGGGEENTASDTRATVGGGSNNTASGLIATVGGGSGNEATAQYATVGGGLNNTASGPIATVGGGSNNTASGSSATVGGGGGNTASGVFATVGGGASNVAAGRGSFSAGQRAKANHDGAFVWSDGPDQDFASTAARQFLIRARGGVGIGTNNPTAGLHVLADSGTRPQLLLEEDESDDFARLRMKNVGSDEYWDVAAGAANTERLNFFASNGRGNVLSLRATGDPLVMYNGARLTAGGTWTNASSRLLKTDFRPVDVQQVLARLVRLPVQTWRYRTDVDARHMGPTAEAFAEAFGLGNSDTAIATVDADGVALAAIQALHEVVQRQQAQIEALQAALHEHIHSSTAHH